MLFKNKFQLVSELTHQLTLREIKSRYKQSFLGYAWVIFNPLAQMLIMSFVFSIILRIPSLGIPYPLFLFSALLPWNLFSNSLSHGVNALVENAPLIKKIYFPREIFIKSTLMAKMVDFLLASLIFVGFAIYYKVTLTWFILWVIPIFLIQGLFTYGLALILASINLFYRDIQHLLNLVLILWMYITPVIYPMEMVPEKYQLIFMLNPMAVIINAYRQVILGGSNPNLSSLSIALILSIFMYLFGKKIFKLLEGLFADVV
jgi:lipopolysaccharide transport system permease protein